MKRRDQEQLMEEESLFELMSPEEQSTRIGEAWQTAFAAGNSKLILSTTNAKQRACCNPAPSDILPSDVLPSARLTISPNSTTDCEPTIQIPEPMGDIAHSNHHRRPRMIAVYIEE